MKNIIIVGLFGLICLSGCEEKSAEAVPASAAEQLLVGNYYKLGDYIMSRDDIRDGESIKHEALYISATQDTTIYLKHQYKRKYGSSESATSISTAVVYPLHPGETIHIQPETGGAQIVIHYLHPSIEKPNHFEIEAKSL